MGTRTSRLQVPIQVHQHHHEERTTTPGEPHGGCPEHGPKHGSQHDAEQWHAEPTVQQQQHDAEPTVPEPEQVPAPRQERHELQHDERTELPRTEVQGEHAVQQHAIDQVMNTVSMMKFMREFMENKYTRMDNIAPRNYDNNQDHSQEFFRRMGNQGMRFKRQVNGNTKPHGSDATNLPGFLELGDRLAEKQKETKEHAIAKIGIFTCVMKEMNVLNDQNQIDVRGMKQELEKYNMPSQWFKNHEIRNIEICYQMSEAVPQSVQDDYEYPGAPN